MMGARFAPSYANLFMGNLEELFIWNINPYGANLILYNKYFDDILVICEGTDSALACFFEYSIGDYVYTFKLMIHILSS